MGIGQRTESKQDTDSVTGEFFHARSSTAGERVSLPLGVSFVQKRDFLISTGGESKAETSLDEFSLPLYRRRNDRDFLFLSDDDELVTAAVIGASAREVFNRAFSRIL